MLFSSRKPRQKQSHSKFKRKLPQGSFSLNWGNRAHRPPVPLPIVGVEVIGYSFTLSMPLRTQEKPPKLRPDLRSRPFFLTFPRTKKGSVAFFFARLPGFHHGISLIIAYRSFLERIRHYNLIVR